MMGTAYGRLPTTAAAATHCTGHQLQAEPAAGLVRTAFVQGSSDAVSCCSRHHTNGPLLVHADAFTWVDAPLALITRGSRPQGRQDASDCPPLLPKLLAATS